MCLSCGSGPSYEEQIERTREKMQDAAGRLGLSHPQVLRFSQELDKLHTCFMKKSKNKQVG